MSGFDQPKTHGSSHSVTGNPHSPGTCMEPAKEPSREDNGLERTPFQVPCLLGRVYLLDFKPDLCREA